MSAFLQSGRSDQQNLAVINVRFRPKADIGQLQKKPALGGALSRFYRSSASDRAEGAEARHKQDGGWGVRIGPKFRFRALLARGSSTRICRHSNNLDTHRILLNAIAWLVALQPPDEILLR